MNRRITKSQMRQLERENKAYPETLKQIPKELWPPNSRAKIIPIELWRSRRFQVLVYAEPNGIERLSIHRTSMEDDGNRFKDGIPWDDLQRLKNECGRGDKEAVEIYPRDADVVDVANMRHLFFLTESMPFTWRKK